MFFALSFFFLQVMVDPTVNPEDDAILRGFMTFGEGITFKSSEDEAAAMEDVAFNSRSNDNAYIRPGDIAPEWMDDLDDNVIGFPPKISSYNSADFSKHPTVTVDKARTQIFKQFKSEFYYVITMVGELPGKDDMTDETEDPAEDPPPKKKSTSNKRKRKSDRDEQDEEDNDGPPPSESKKEAWNLPENCDKIVTLLVGEDSHIYRVFKDAIGLPYKKFCKFLATFFFICRQNQNLNEMWKDRFIDTSSFMAPKIFHKILRKMDKYGKDMHHHKLFWEELEDAFNKTTVTNFYSKTKGTTLSKKMWTMDDDKLHFNYGALRDVKWGTNSRLKRVRHTRDNRKGANNHVIAYAASDIPIASMFEHEDHLGLFDCVIDLMKTVFNFKSGTKPNLSGKATLAVDIGYMRAALLAWWLETGADIMGTVMRGLNFVPFTFSKGDKEKSAGSRGPDEAQIIPVKGYKTVYQKTAKCKVGSVNRAITCTAYSSGTSSSVAMFLSSRERGIEWDLVLADAHCLKRYTKYFKSSQSSREKGQRFMDAFVPLRSRYKGDWYKIQDERRDEFVDLRRDEDPEVDDDTLLDEFDYRWYPDMLKNTQGVQPLCWVQLCAAWWMMRQLALTSSTSDKLIIAAAPFIDTNHPQRANFERILEYTGQSHLLPNNAAPAQEQDDDNDNDDDEGEGDADSVPSVSTEFIQSVEHGRLE